MDKQRRSRTPLVVVLGFLAFLAVPAAAQATASVPPVKVDGNPKCADYGMTKIAKYEGGSDKWGKQGPVTVQVHHRYYVKWTSTVAVDWVIVKGGPNSNIYKYPYDTFGDDWLHAPMNGSKPYDLSHLEFCSDGKDEPKPTPGISVDKSGPAAAYVGEQVTYTFAVKNTGNVKLTDLEVEDDRCAPLTKVADGDTSFDPNDVWTYTCTMTVTAAMGDKIVNTVEACAKGAGTKKCDTDTHTTKILDPGVLLEKTGASFAYAGDTVTYAFKATNTGNVTLANVVLTDDKCQDTLVRKAGETDTSFEKGDVWNFTCTAVVPAGVTSVKNVAEVCGTATGPGVEAREVCDEDDHTFPVRSIAIAIDKQAVEQTAVAGATVNFTIAVTNTGTTAYVDYVFDDPACAEVRSGSNAGDTMLEPGETWTYTCAMATQVGQTVATNTATATGTNSDGRSATATDDAQIPLTQPQTPGENPPGGNPPSVTPDAVPPGTTPGGGVLPDSRVSGRARLRGPSGCVKRAFRARVRGRSIASVTFFVDGRKVKTVRRGNAFRLKVKPSKYGLGRHKIVARVRFTAASGTKARKLQLTFRRCAQGAVAPRFTG